MTQGSFLVSSASSLAEISTSVIGSLSVEVVGGGWTGRNSGVREHLAELLGGGRHDRDEIGFTQPPLDTMALQISARAAMKHRGMRCCDAGVACAQTKGDDLAPIAVVFIVGIARQRHGLAFELAEQLLEVHRLLRQIAVDMAERPVDLLHDVDAVLDQAERHAELQQDESGADL